MGKRKPDMEKIRAALAAYFEQNSRFSIPGLCLALDICKETLACWEQGFLSPGDNSRNAQLSDTIKKAKLRIEQYLLENDTKSSSKDMAVLNSFYGYKQTAGGEFGGEVEMDLGMVGEWGD